MPPKRKAAAAKATETIENGSESTEPTKPKRGKIAKATEKVEKPDVEDAKKTRSGRAKAAPLEERITTEAETKKEKKGRGKAEKPAEDEAPVKEAPAKKVTAKKKETKPEKNQKATKKTAAAKPKIAVKTSPKAQRARRVKKGDDDAENEKEPPKAKGKTASKKKKPSATVTSENATGNDKPKSKKPRTKAATEATSGPTPLNKTETDYSTIDFNCTKENSVGELANFKISSWNVDGLRAWMKKNGMEYIKQEHPDILCLQETRCSEDKIPDELKEISNYKAYWCFSNKDGYAGVALFSEKEPLNVIRGIGNEEFDEEGRCLTAEYDGFYVINVYVPNAGRGLVTLPKRLEWNTIFNEYVAKLDEKKPVIVCGDMNVAHNEIDIANPKGNRKNAGFTDEEREGMTEFLSDKYIDTYRKLYPDRTNSYTFWSYLSKARVKNIGWRLDYFIVSNRLMDKVCDNVIRSEVFGSDHCPIVLYINV